ncbi:spermatogenesis-associated serine-rich protein 1 [Sminthopsis crassicaudata]|uniref:spermatogenesis-associated serine-rich protein 1 n=1 Tax=Sminthopsis crassicaudata TaxID=9301 RepID=UPI003D68C7FB
MEPRESFSLVVEEAKNEGTNGNGSLEPEEHEPSVNPLPHPIPSSVVESSCCVQVLPKGQASTDHPTADAKLLPRPSLLAIDDALATNVIENEYPKEIILLNQKDAEWSFYPRHGHLHTYHKGKKCHFDGVFRAYQRFPTEITLDKCFGRKKYDIDERNGLPERTPGDKPYLKPEECPDFYKDGATVIPMNFSRIPYVKKVDTFIPLEPLPKEYHLPYFVKEKKMRKKKEIKEVEELDAWMPAVPLMDWLFPPVAVAKQKVVTV